MTKESTRLVGLLLALALLVSCGPSLEYTTKTKPDTPTAGDATESEAPVATSTSTFEGGGDLQLAMVDVGQGDGMVLIAPNGKTVIIDTGVKEGGKNIVEFLKSQGIKTVDLMVLTHPHADHIGGAKTVLENIEVLRVLDPGTTHESSTYKRLFEKIEELGIPVLIAKRGRKIKLDEHVEMTILAPFDPQFSGTRSDANANSIVMRLVYGDISIIFTGDAEAETEHGLIEHASDDAPLRSTVLKVAHHGSAYASIKEFVDLVDPRAALISCGKGNTYGHPNGDTMGRIAEHTPHIFRTDEQGTLSLITNGKTLRIAPERGEAVDIPVR